MVQLQGRSRSILIVLKEISPYIFIFTCPIGVDFWVGCEQIQACDTLEQRLRTQRRPETSLRTLDSECRGTSGYVEDKE